MTLKQANQVNKYYLDKEKEVELLKDSIYMQNLLSDAQYRYSLYLEAEFKKKYIEASKEYEEKEKMWEYKVNKQARTNIYIFVAMTLLSVLVKF